MKRVIASLSIASLTLISAYGSGVHAEEANQPVKVVVGYKANSEKFSKGQISIQLLGSTNWQGTKVYDSAGNDLTSYNGNYIGLAKYEGETGRYEFFDKKTGDSRGDKGIFFVTNDGKFRGLISETFKYQAIVELTELNENKFTYKRTGKDASGADVTVFVEHIPYTETTLKFTDPPKDLNTETGKIVKDVDGDRILSDTTWRGTVALDKDGNDVSAYNGNFLGLAKYDYDSNRYEFFDATTGESRGDYGYFDVVNGNKQRANISLGRNYGVALELTELNKDKFTYKRTGKDADGNDIAVTVEHVPYDGLFKLEFTSGKVKWVLKTNKDSLADEANLPNWAKDDINELYKYRIVSGYEDKKFKAQNQVTRAEFVTLIYNALDLKSESEKLMTELKDLKGHWAVDTINSLRADGYVTGMSGDYFGADNPITREQAATIIQRVLKLKSGKGHKFADSDKVSDWATDAIDALYTADLMIGYKDHIFKPKNNLSRAEAAKLVHSVLEKTEDLATMRTQAKDGVLLDNGKDSPGDNWEKAK